MTVYVDDQLCGNYPGIVEVKATITCAKVMKGSSVRVQNGLNALDRHLLAICEAIVIGYEIMRKTLDY